MTALRPAGVLETVLYAQDLGAAEDFYTNVLGLTMYSRMPPRPWRKSTRCRHSAAEA